MTSFKWTPSATLPKKPVSFAGVGYDEMLRRARDLRPKFAERATACEQLRRLPDETERDLHEAGIFRMVQPARVGGHGFQGLGRRCSAPQVRRMLAGYPFSAQRCEPGL